VDRTASKSIELQNPIIKDLAPYSTLNLSLREEITKNAVVETEDATRIIQNPTTERDSEPISSTPRPRIYHRAIATSYNFTFSQAVSNKHCICVLVFHTVSTPADHSNSKDCNVLTTLRDLRILQGLSFSAPTIFRPSCLKSLFSTSPLSARNGLENITSSFQVTHPRFAVDQKYVCISQYTVIHNTTCKSIRQNLSAYYKPSSGLLF
jgi:hypothetical protein